MAQQISMSCPARILNSIDGRLLPNFGLGLPPLPLLSQTSELPIIKCLLAFNSWVPMATVKTSSAAPFPTPSGNVPFSPAEKTQTHGPNRRNANPPSGMGLPLQSFRTLARKIGRSSRFSARGGAALPSLTTNAVHWGCWLPEGVLSCPGPLVMSSSCPQARIAATLPEDKQDLSSPALSRQGRGVIWQPEVELRMFNASAAFNSLFAPFLFFFFFPFFPFIFAFISFLYPTILCNNAMKGEESVFLPPHRFLPYVV